jgi:predicted O-methyltransferase YrrM
LRPLRLPALLRAELALSRRAARRAASPLASCARTSATGGAGALELFLRGRRPALPAFRACGSKGSGIAVIYFDCVPHYASLHNRARASVVEQRNAAMASSGFDSQACPFRAASTVQAAEGHLVHSEQMQRLTELARAHGASRIFEIGFNAGHSSELFLMALPEAAVLSVDIGMHPYVLPAKAAIDRFYPGRHTLVIGDSTQTVPVLAKSHLSDAPYGLIFIDGGHEYAIARADLENCRALAGPDTVVIMDDTHSCERTVAHFNHGPNRAWAEAVAAGMIEPLGQEDYAPSRGMSWGRYKRA